MSVAKLPESTELDPVVIEYGATVERIRKNGDLALEGWIARLKTKTVRDLLSTRRSDPPLAAEVKKFVALKQR